jgi:hypothetical protein
MFSSHSPGKAGSVMVLHGVSRQHVSAQVKPAVAKKKAKVVASIIMSRRLSPCQDSKKARLLLPT